jgi:hypothetical protein
MSSFKLPTPARYTPWTKGKYDVAPALKPLGTDYGNGSLDAQWFQLDSRFDEFRQSKKAAIEERFEKYVHRSRLSQDVELAACTAIGTSLAKQYPQWFSFDGINLHPINPITGEPMPSVSTLNDLALLVEEDICVVCTEDGRDWLAYAHICSPSHWRAEEKIGKSFFDVHEVIPGIEGVNRVAGKMVEAMVQKGPFVRFVWGVESDPRPNHHPDPPPGEDPRMWDGRDFTKGEIWLRAERQVIWGLPEVNATIFTIKVSHTPGSEVLQRKELLDPLITSLESMSLESREYKGLASGWDSLMSLLNPRTTLPGGHPETMSNAFRSTGSTSAGSA